MEHGYRFFCRQGWFGFNYRGEKTVQGLGIYLFLHYLLYIVIVESVHFLWDRSFFPFPSSVWLFVFLSFCLAGIGWIDDRWGEVTVKGFKGHLSRFFRKKEVTTGLQKAAVGLICALLVCLPVSSSLGEYGLRVLAMVLSIHVFNLLDVRPGRAIKSFWLFTLSLLPFLSPQLFGHLLLPLFLATVVLFRYDRLRLAMLGDTGSLTLGGSFGFQLINDAPLFLVAVWTAIFFTLTVVAEKRSISVMIDQTKWLSKLDRWGIARE